MGLPVDDTGGRRAPGGGGMGLPVELTGGVGRPRSVGLPDAPVPPLAGPVPGPPAAGPAGRRVLVGVAPPVEGGGACLAAGCSGRAGADGVAGGVVAAGGWTAGRGAGRRPAPSPGSTGRLVIRRGSRPEGGAVGAGVGAGPVGVPTPSPEAGAGAGASAAGAGAAAAGSSTTVAAAFLAADFLTGSGSGGETSRRMPSWSALRRARSAWASSML
jgi:hypothetical protein